MPKIALVTGASAGLGQAIAKRLVADGYLVIISARRLKRLKTLQELLGADKVYPLQMDLSQPQQIKQALATLPEAWQKIDILINNAGLALGLDKAYEADFSDWLTMINTNIIGLTYLTRQLLATMVERRSGFIINLGSTAGTFPYPGGNVYGASKAFVAQFSRNLRADLLGTPIRVTNIEPGLCEGTEFSQVRFKGDEERARQLYQGAHVLQPEDIANTVSWLLSQPDHVNVNRIELMPVSQSFGAHPVFRD